jgi:hypothetical protein
MNNVMMIGRYQLGNLQRHDARFTLVLVEDEPGNYQPPTPESQALLRGVVRLRPDEVLNHVRAMSVSNDHPIVLISEDDGKSMAAASQLDADSFINVFVYAGGVKEL